MSSSALSNLRAGASALPVSAVGLGEYRATAKQHARWCPLR